jgi:hypothetical protein
MARASTIRSSRRQVRRAELEAARPVYRDGVVTTLPKLLDNLADALQKGESVTREASP